MTRHHRSDSLCVSCTQKTARWRVVYRDVALGTDDLREYTAELCTDDLAVFRVHAQTANIPILDTVMIGSEEDVKPVATS